jgi:hypothetical protein
MHWSTFERLRDQELEAHVAVSQALLRRLYGPRIDLSSL